MKDLSVEDKALSINLQPSIYGTFAEIGAGQEVANYFYKVGAASGTVAKTISAYDMTLSDGHYGNTKRYVSKDRLENMLSTEYEELVQGLKAKAPIAHFFAFASTVEITNYHRTNKGRGWMGIKFQTSPNGAASTCKLHFILHNENPEEQKKIIGVLGVNLVHGVYEDLDHPEFFIKSLSQNIRLEDIEINSIEVDGQDFKHTSTNQLSLMLVKYGLTKMIMFGYDGEIVQPLSALHRKDLLLIRGRFNPPTKVSVEMLEKSKAQIVANSDQKVVNILPVAEITFKCFEDSSELEPEDLEQRIEMLSQMNVMTMITNFTFHSEFVDFISSYSTVNNMHLVLGLNNLRRVFQPQIKGSHLGETLHFIQAISESGYRVLAFPELNEKGDLIGMENMGLDKPSTLLLTYLIQIDAIENIQNVNKEILTIRSENARQLIRKNDVNWKYMVPTDLAQWMEANFGKKGGFRSVSSSF